MVNILARPAFWPDLSAGLNSIGQILPITCFKVVKEFLQSYLDPFRSQEWVLLQIYSGQLYILSLPEKSCNLQPEWGTSMSSSYMSISRRNGKIRRIILLLI